MVVILFLFLSFLTSCADTGYQSSYIISKVEEEKEASEGGK